jgi:protoporphyrinogen oxidase
MWEEVGCQIRAKGGQIHFGLAVNQVGIESDRVAWVGAKDASGEQRVFRGDFFFSTMAIKDLVRAIGDRAPNEVTQVSEGLQYRDFITVGLLVKKLRVHDPGGQVRQLIRDNWIYIQEPDVLAGRLQIFNNWSPALVSDPDTVWLGVEYFCYDTDELWKKADGAMAELAAEELDRIGIIDKSDVLDSTVLRVPKTYPAYFGAYARFDEVRRYLDSLLNLFPVGRNGMHKYNNQDHSMLTAMTAVDNIIAGRTDKSNLWQVNTEMEYHESKSAN